eukprot:UN11577
MMSFSNYNDDQIIRDVDGTIICGYDHWMEYSKKFKRIYPKIRDQYLPCIYVEEQNRKNVKQKTCRKGCNIRKSKTITLKKR